MSNPNRVHRGAWLVYLNGIEVPCPDVTVSYGVWQIPEATLSFAPHHLLERLGAEDRLEVVIFYLDDLIDPEKPQFRLLFEGEIVGWSYQNSPFGRTITFTALADIAVFTELYFFFMNTVDAATQYHAEPQAASAPAATNVFYPASLFYKGLLRTTGKDGKPSPDITRPYELVYNAVRGMTASEVPPEQRTIPAVNFFSRWVRKRNFQNRFVALPVFEDDAGDPTQGVFPIFKAAKCASAMDAVQNGLAPTIGERGTVFDVLRETLEKTYMELVMLPTAPAYRVDLKDGVILEQHNPTDRVEPAKPLRLANYFAKPQMLFGIPPTCNVIFPGMIRSATFQENYRQQPTRVYVNDGFIPSLLDQNYFTAASLRVGYPPEVNATMQQAAASRTVGGNASNASFSPRAFQNAKNILVFPEEFFKGPVLSRTAMPQWFSMLLRFSKVHGAKPETGTGELPAAVKEELNHYDKLFQSYAHYEYFRQRYEKRGGAVNLTWDPYVVPGFPCVVFDTRTQGLDTVGYLTRVTHTLSARGRGTMKTDIEYSHGRTFREMLDEVHTVAVEHGIATGNAPLDPLEPVRAIANDFTKAETFYQALFFGRAGLEGKKASFDFRDVVGFTSNADSYGENATVEEIVHGTSSSDAMKIAGDWVPAASEVWSNLGRVLAKDTTITPRPGFADVFRSTDAAMRYVARPICTLEEYIAFLYPQDSIEKLEDAGILEARDMRFAYEEGGAMALRPPATYWGRIKALRPGPGPKPEIASLGATSTPEGAAKVYTPAVKAIPALSAQTRQDWDQTLVKYRQEVYAKQFQG